MQKIVRSIDIGYGQTTFLKESLEQQLAQVSPQINNEQGIAVNFHRKLDEDNEKLKVPQARN